MDKIINVLELLNTLMHSTIGGMVKICKDTLSHIVTYLQIAQENIEFLQLESHL